MNKYIFTIFTMLIVWFSINSPLFASTPKESKSVMSKSELCDVAIQAIEQILSQSPETKKNPIISKEQCMAISDEDIDNAVKKLMADQSKK